MNRGEALYKILTILDAKDNGILKYHPQSHINFELLRENVPRYEQGDHFKSAFKDMCLRTMKENASYTILHKHALRMYIFGLHVILQELLIYDEDDERPCTICNEISFEDKTLLCDCCNDPYHTFCLNEPLQDIPQGTWFCIDCSVLEQNYLYQRRLSFLDRKENGVMTIEKPKDISDRIKQKLKKISSSSSEDDKRKKTNATNKRKRTTTTTATTTKPTQNKKQQKQKVISSSSSSSSSYSSSDSSSEEEKKRKKKKNSKGPTPLSLSSSLKNNNNNTLDRNQFNQERRRLDQVSQKMKSHTIMQQELQDDINTLVQQEIQLSLLIKSHTAEKFRIESYLTDLAIHEGKKKTDLLDLITSLKMQQPNSIEIGVKQRAEGLQRELMTIEQTRNNLSQELTLKDSIIYTQMATRSTLAKKLVELQNTYSIRKEKYQQLMQQQKPLSSSSSTISSSLSSSSTSTSTKSTAMNVTKPPTTPTPPLPKPQAKNTENEWINFKRIIGRRLKTNKLQYKVVWEAKEIVPSWVFIEDV